MQHPLRLPPLRDHCLARPNRRLGVIGSPGPSITSGSNSFVLWSWTNDQTKATMYSFVATKALNILSGIRWVSLTIVCRKWVDKGLMLTSVQTGTEVAEASSTLRRYVQYCELIVVQGV